VIHRRADLLIFVLLAILAWSPIALAAPRDPSRPAARISVHYLKKDLSQVIEGIARATGERFVYGDSVRGVVSISVPQRVSRGEALEILNAALFLKGYAAIRMGDGTNKIVPIIETASISPVEDPPAQSDSERFITTLVALQYAKAGDVVTALSSMISRHGVALAYEPTNSVILAATESQVRRLITMVRVLDRSSDVNLAAFTLRYVSAGTMVGMVEEIFNQSPVAANRAELWTDERTNMMLVRAYDELLDEIREFVYDMDRPVSGGGLIQVVPVINRDVTEIADILRGLAEGPSQGPPSQQVAESRFGGELSGRRYSITADVASRSLLVQADPETFDLLSRVVSELDVIPPRISVDVLVFEVQKPSGFSIGVDYFLPVKAPSDSDDFAVAIQSNPSGGGTPRAPSGSSVLFGRYARDPVLLNITDDQGNVVTIPIPREDVSFQAGAQSVQTSILMRPHLLVLSGEEHELFSGNNIPIPVQSAGSTNADGSQAETLVGPTIRQDILREDVGVRLRVKPTLGQEGTIMLQLDLEVSNVTQSLAGDIEVVGATIAERVVTATIPLQPGQHAIIGTTQGTTKSYARRGVPFLMNIPFFGYFFSRLDETVNEVDLVIVAEAEVMRTHGEDVAETIRRRLAFERSLSRTADLGSLNDAPYAVLLDSVPSDGQAQVIAKAFAEDGFETRVTRWEASGSVVYDVYLTDIETFDDAGALSRRLNEAGWTPEITILQPENELAGD
jgi:general secretion pathway protein D